MTRPKFPPLVLSEPMPRIALRDRLSNFRGAALALVLVGIGLVAVVLLTPLSDLFFGQR